MRTAGTESLSQIVGRLWDAKSNRNRVALVSGQGYIVFSSRGRHRPVVVQAAGGRNLPDGVKLTPEQVGTLSGYGLRQRRASADYQLEIARDQSDRLAPVISAASSILTDVYGAASENQSVRFRFDSVPDLDNSELEEAMNHLARQRDWAARTGLYMKMVRSQLICAVATEAGSEPRSSLDPYHAGSIGPFPTVAIFTSFEALDNYSAVGLPARVIAGMDLFPALLALKVGSVLINPKGGPRGELYNNELHIIVDGIKKLRGVH